MRIQTKLAMITSSIKHRINPNFKNYNQAFKNLTQETRVGTMHPIVSMIITYDSRRAITVTKVSDKKYQVTQYSLRGGFNVLFSEIYGGKPNSYIKMKDVEQNSKGDKFCAAYYDNGHFFLRMFGTQSRSQEEIDKSEFNINEALQINNYTAPISGFCDPYITAAFVNDRKVFVNLFHNHQLLHYHFFYDSVQK